ncbi:ROK family transcriptional regulator [Tropicimonas aquimaris]|uniref:ROK family protein n=1 Tax=Tropicimonas aquimaris TaxID=914152 RepID=A0ABW3IUB6_9RHOB
MRGSNQSGLRAHNERLVLSLLRREGPMAKAEIARVSGLSAQIISGIMRRLEEDGLLKRGEPIRGKVGQPSMPMHLAPDGAYFLGLKIGRRSVDLILIDFVGTVLGRVHQTHPYPTPDAVMGFALEALEELQAKLPPDKRPRIAGLGIAIPFRLWDWAVSIGAPLDEMEAWRDRDIRTELAGRLEFPVYLCNDASAACGAELVFGSGERPQVFLHFFIGYFIGGGLVLNGSLYTGRTGNAAALGSLPIPGPAGTYAQLVDVASLCVLEQEVRAAGRPTESLWNPPEHWDVPPAILDTWISEASASLAYAIAAATSVIDSEVVMIDGWLPVDVRRKLVEGTDLVLRDLDVGGIEKPNLRAGTIGQDARSLGAASLPLSDRYLLDLNAMMLPS